MATSKKKPENKALMRRKVSLSLTTREGFIMKTKMKMTENKEKLLVAAKVGIIKQLYKDKLITANQYQYLLHKYGCSD